MSRATVSPRGDFTEILEALQRAADDGAGAQTRMSEQQLREMLDAIPELSDDNSYIPSQILARIYAEARAQQSRAETPPERKPEPPPDPRSEDEIVADELQLTPKLTIADLLRIRREYAMNHHPDRVPPSEREQATRRMTIANMLIDQAMRERRAAARRR